MKALFSTVFAVSVLFLTSCKENKESKTETMMSSDMQGMNHNSSDSMEMQNMQSMGNTEMTESNTPVPVTNAPKNSKTDFSNLYTNYQQMADALSSDDDKKAVAVATNMLTSLNKVDKTTIPADQKKEYADLEADIKEHAEHIKSNGGNIEHQREHMDMLSKDFYDLAKTFGTAKPVYKIFCPMYNDNKGAYWLSSSKEVKNPYYGKGMLTCGEVQEEIK
ncbi:DUF3347 domain-containing protein [Kaistella polysaccharea]|uniref:DUF3347 domain-containing protein n=1 Tax=Kaistella polysaccharea TaxID=2878534 RepID=UPI001CF3F07F|nr:DUF3347 domain-containing protein [Kaistella polysaccharea]